MLTAPSLALGTLTLTSVGGWRSTEGLGVGEMEGWTELEAGMEVEDGVTTGVVESTTGILEATTGVLEIATGILEATTGVLKVATRLLE